MFYSILDIREQGFYELYLRLNQAFNASKRKLFGRTTYEDCFKSLGKITYTMVIKTYLLEDKYFSFEQYIDNCKKLNKQGQMFGMLDHYDEIQDLAKQGKIRTILC